MASKVYYNENDKFAVKWLKELISSKLIPCGEVDDRSILEVKPDDLSGFNQCHFFAGIAGWAYALQLAGWPQDREVWTGSCPCQPFSVAGKGKGTADERHLWPAFRRLIAERKPATIFGEQVASRDGRLWLAGVRADLEAMGYAVGAADLCAAGIGAPHIRQRLYWVANASSERPRYNDGTPTGQNRERLDAGSTSIRQTYREVVPSWIDAGKPGCFNGVADRQREGSSRIVRSQVAGVRDAVERCAGDDLRMVNAIGERQQKQRGAEPMGAQQSGAECASRGPWADSIFIPCADGKWRRVPARRVDDAIGVRRWGTRKQRNAVNIAGESSQPSAGEGDSSRREDNTGCGIESPERLEAQRIFQLVASRLSADLGPDDYRGVLEAAKGFPLSETIPARVGILKGAGNSIIPILAAEFIKSFIETKGED